MAGRGVKTGQLNQGGREMAEFDSFLYACCPKCSKPIGRSKRCDGMELNCPKCGSPLRVTVDQNARVLVEIVQKDRERAPA